MAVKDCELRLGTDDDSRVRVGAEDTPVSLGRGQDSDVVIDGNRVSRRHALLLADDNGWRIRDLDSTNGVFVNDQRVREATLNSGDEIRLGSSPIGFRHAGQPSVVMDETALASLESAVIDVGALQDGGDGAAASEWAEWMLPLVASVTETLHGEAELEDKLEGALRAVLERLPADQGSICAFDAQGEELIPMVALDSSGNEPSEVVLSRTLADQALEKGQATLVHEISDLGDSGDVSRSLVSLGSGSVVCVPLVRHGERHGLIYVHSASRSRPLGESHLAVLSAVGLMVGAELGHARMRGRLDEEKKLRERLARYHSPNVVRRLMDVQETTFGRMLGEACEATVLFSDFVGFTSVAERMAPGEVVGVLNEVFQRLTDVVFDLDGTVDKYLGDGMMVLFGTPLAQPDHAVRAVRAGLRMQEAIEEANRDLGLEPPLRMRVGIETGEVIAGDIGAMDRRDYTAIGDTVNKAARLESQVAAPGQVAIGPGTGEAVRDHFVCEPLDPVILRGRSDKVTPYIVEGPRADAPSAAEVAVPDRSTDGG